MSRSWKLTLAATAALFVTAVVLAVSGFYLIRSNWLREAFRQRIVTEAERATGGNVEIDKFLFDWKTLTAEIDGFVIHGTEPRGSAPLLKVSKLVVGFKIVSLARKDIDILYARLESPQAFLLIAQDGSTNIPSPKVPIAHGKSGMETILDLKIADVSLSGGSVEIHAAGQTPKRSAYDLTGKNLLTKLRYRAAGPSILPKYAGTISIQPLDVRYGDYRGVQLGVEMDLELDRNRLQFNSAKFRTASSHVELSGNLQNFTAPVVATQYEGEVSLQEVGAILKLKSIQSGKLQISGEAKLSGSLDYLVSGRVHGRGLNYSGQGLKLVGASLASSLRIDPQAVKLTRLTAGLLGGNVSGQAVIKNLDSYDFSGTLANFDIATIAGRPLPYDGVANGPFQLRGRFSDPRDHRSSAAATLAISPSPKGLPVQGSLDVKYDAALNQITLGHSYLVTQNSRLDLRGVLGQRLQAVLESRSLDDLLPALALTGEKQFPFSIKAGSVRFDGSVTGPLESLDLEGHVSSTNVVYSGQLVESLNADLTARNNLLALRNANLTYQAVRTAFQGSVALVNWKIADSSSLNVGANLQNADLTGLLALAGRSDIPLTGTISIAGQVAGTVGNPQTVANFTLLNGAAHSEPFDRITGKVDSPNASTQQLTAVWRAGARQINVSAHYAHAAGDFRTGMIGFQLASNRMQLGQFSTIRKAQPALAGMVTLNAGGEIALARSGIRLTQLNGDMQSTGVTVEGRELSDYKLNARTDGGLLKVHLQSNLAHAEIAGDGAWQLTGNYPGSAQIDFAKVDLATVRKLMMSSKGAQALSFGGSAEGRATITGSLLKPEKMTADLDIPKFEFRPEVTGSLRKELSDVTIRNTQPIRLRLSDSLIRIESARFTGPNTDLSLLGSVNFKQKEPLNLNLNGNVDLQLARSFNSGVDSSGNLLVRVTVHGSFEQPELGGLADLRNGNFSVDGFPNGLSKANGRLTFDENRVIIQSLTAQTGGGTVQFDGFAAFGGPAVNFRLTAAGKSVRVRYPEGFSSVSDANLIWTGSSLRSVLSGDVVVHKVTYNQQSDFGSLLALTSSGPVPTGAAPTGLLGGTQFDIRVQTAPDISLQTGLISGLQTDANLRLRGTAANPSLLGRISIDSGNISFLGNKYLINEGTISFFNPAKIEPILDVDLETQALGVDVTLSISGPLNKLNVTYRSDPPLQFSDIVGLLATGKTPSDPTIAARQTDTQQTWQQLGASALIGQALANPVSGRLQRFFGVSKIKIDPLLSGLGGAGSSTGGANPGARLSLEQQIAPNITFDYVISTNTTSSQVVRVEYAFSKHWSAVILREENSAFGIDFQYKKRFK